MPVVKNKISSRADRLIAALDVGSTKVCCLVARINSDDEIKMLGAGNRISRGVKNGIIVDMDSAELSIRTAVEQAEGVADERIQHVIVNLSAGDPRSHIVEQEIAISGHGVEQSDIERVLLEASQKIDLGDRSLLHAFPACFSLDDAIGVRDPIGMFGKKLSTALHVIDASPGPMQNLHTCVARGHLHPDRMVLSAYASGLATLAPDEKELGAACVDLGGGTTSISVFAQGAMVYGSVIPLGGQHITEAIASKLLTPIEAAERLKTLHGSAVATRSDEQQFIDVPILGENQNEDGFSRVPRSSLTTLIQPRLEKIFMNVKQKLAESGFDAVSGNRVVLTGGGSLLPGVRELAQKILNKQVRLGRPVELDGVAELARGPAFATCTGLLLYAVNAPLEMGEYSSSPTAFAPKGGVFGKLGHWFARNF